MLKRALDAAMRFFPERGERVLAARAVLHLEEFAHGELVQIDDLLIDGGSVSRTVWQHLQRRVSLRRNSNVSWPVHCG